MDTKESSAPQTFERRAYIRYARKLETFWTYLGVGSSDRASGEVFDLSTTGVGLRLDQAFPPGSTLVLRLPTTTLGWSSHLVRVIRCDETSAGQFTVGCTFVKPLSLTQFESLVRG